MGIFSTAGHEHNHLCRRLARDRAKQRVATRKIYAWRWAQTNALAWTPAMQRLQDAVLAGQSPITPAAENPIIRVLYQWPSREEWAKQQRARETKTMIGSEPAAVFEDRETAGQWRVEKVDQEGGCDARISPVPMPASRRSTMPKSALWNLCREAARALLARCHQAYSGNDQVALKALKSYRSPPRKSGPMTLADIASEGVRLLIGCLACRHQVAPDLAELATRQGAATTVSDWQHRLVCSQCGSREIDIVVK